MPAISFIAGVSSAFTLFSNYWGWIVGGLIVIIGLLVIGLDDVKRFSVGRIWAISGVCFDESIRKKVLWITPLAIIGVIVVTQLQRALDEQDAIRQTIKFCLFASGLVVILSSIILACTNLPKEIENRVIFTIVTKPTTRLELILGKIVGFARVSATILIIMGLFTWIYLAIREHSKLSEISTRISNGTVTATEKSRLTHYEETGLLSARKLWAPDELQIYGDKPDLATGNAAIRDDGNGDFLVPFELDHSVVFPDGPNSGIGEFGLVVRIDLNWTSAGPIQDSPDPDEVPAPAGPVLGPAVPTTRPKPEPRPPGVTVEVLDAGRFSLVSSASLLGATNMDKLRSETALWVQDPKKTALFSGYKIRLHKQGESNYAYAWINPTEAVNHLYSQRFIYVSVTGANVGAIYPVGKEPIRLYVPKVADGHIVFEGSPADEIRAALDPSGQIASPIFRGRIGIHGDQELTGGSDLPRQVAVYSFHKAPSADLIDGNIPFEIANLQLQRSNDSDNEDNREDPTTLDVTVHDNASNKDTTTSIQVETRESTFFSVPASAITGPDYEILLTCGNKGHTVGFYPVSLQLVVARESFAVNLIKSLGIIWMMSILVIILSILCSTFLSWPIAIVLTVILLLGHWGVDQLADANAPGLGRQIVNDFRFGNDASIAKVVSSSVDTLSSGLNKLASVLPDTGQFDSISEIEQGVTVSNSKIKDAFAVMGGFGLPAAVLAYLFLKYKEVAP